MDLNVRPPVFALPSYSLTGDLVAFMRCGLQYRFGGIGRMPSAHPVQLWFGQFIHGVLEEAYRRYEDDRQKGIDNPPPWPDDVVNEIRDLIKKRLSARGIAPWDDRVEKVGDRRAEAAINELGPELFPLICQAEVRLTGARPMRDDPRLAKYKFRDVDRYEVAGVVDVITHVALHDPHLSQCQLVKLITSQLKQQVPSEFEIIIDYKGMRRPPMQAAGGPDYWNIYGWQVQTYSYLRQMQPGSLPTVAGAIIYLNELVPTGTDMELLKQELKAGTTDVRPNAGSQAEKFINGWKTKSPPPALPIDFRLRRAVRVVEVSKKSIQQSLDAFDEVVTRIETCRGKEVHRGKIMSSWEKNPSDPSTCTACDAQTFCPSYTGATQPDLPAVPNIS